MEDVTSGTEIVRVTEQEAQTNVHAVLQLCAGGKLRCSETTRRPTAATITAVAGVLSAGDFFPDHAIAAFAWPLLLHAGGLAEQTGNRLQLTARGRAVRCAGRSATGILPSRPSTAPPSARDCEHSATPSLDPSRRSISATRGGKA